MFLYRQWVFTAAFIVTTPIFGLFISNLSESCARCLCEGATGCNVTIGCKGRYCGPFRISKVYWVDSGRIVLPDDTPLRELAYNDCARDYDCALTIVTGYLLNYGQDCNGDGKVDCDDYAMIHYSKRYGCEPSITNSRSYKQYEACTQDTCDK